MVGQFLNEPLCPDEVYTGVWDGTLIKFEYKGDLFQVDVGQESPHPDDPIKFQVEECVILMDTIRRVADIID